LEKPRDGVPEEHKTTRSVSYNCLRSQGFRHRARIEQRRKIEKKEEAAGREGKGKGKENPQETKTDQLKLGRPLKRTRPEDGHRLRWCRCVMCMRNAAKKGEESNSLSGKRPINALVMVPQVVQIKIA